MYSKIRRDNNMLDSKLLLSCAFAEGESGVFFKMSYRAVKGQHELASAVIAAILMRPFGNRSAEYNLQLFD